MNKSIAIRIRETLLSIPTLVKDMPFAGICGLFNLKSDDPGRYWATREDSKTANVWLDEAIARWPDRSEHPHYPVPCAKRSDPVKAFFNTTNKWDLDTDYGRSRWALWRHLVAEAELLVEEFPDDNS